MVSIPYFSMNRPSGIAGIFLAVFGLGWFVFGIVYVVSGVKWEGSSGPALAWIIVGIVILLLALGFAGLGGGLCFYNTLVRRRENRGEKDLKQEMVKFFDLNRLEGGLAVPQLSLSTVLLVNGIVFYIVNKAMYEPQNMDAKRIAQDFKGMAVWVFVFMFALWIGAGLCLFINRYYVMQYEDRMREKGLAEDKETSGEKKKKGSEGKNSQKKKDTDAKTKIPPPPPED